jgi:hypothetical protein
MTMNLTMRVRHSAGGQLWTPRRASSIRLWMTSWRNDDWVASRFGLG